MHKPLQENVASITILSTHLWFYHARQALQGRQTLPRIARTTAGSTAGITRGTFQSAYGSLKYSTADCLR